MALEFIPLRPKNLKNIRFFRPILLEGIAFHKANLVAKLKIVTIFIS